MQKAAGQLQTADSLETMGIVSYQHTFSSNALGDLRGMVRGPGIELLEYLSPPDGLPFPLDEHANDVIHRQMVLVTRSTDEAARDLSSAKVNFVSSGVIANQMDELGYSAAFTVRDPDGHAVEIEQK